MNIFFFSSFHATIIVSGVQIRATASTTSSDSPNQLVSISDSDVDLLSFVQHTALTTCDLLPETSVGRETPDRIQLNMLDV